MKNEMKGGDSTPVCVDVVEAIADLDQTEAHELSYALHDHVNTEALELLVKRGSDSAAICFEVPGHEVVVEGDRTVHVDGEEFTQDR